MTMAMAAPSGVAAGNARLASTLRTPSFAQRGARAVPRAGFFDQIRKLTGGGTGDVAAEARTLTRDEYDELELEQYFNYMGILATEGNYDSMTDFKSSGLHPMEIILLLAAREGDTSRVKEILNVGPDTSVKDPQGNDIKQLAGANKPEKREEILQMIEAYERGEEI